MGALKAAMPAAFPAPHAVSQKQDATCGGHTCMHCSKCKLTPLNPKAHLFAATVAGAAAAVGIRGVPSQEELIWWGTDSRIRLE